MIRFAKLLIILTATGLAYAAEVWSDDLADSNKEINIESKPDKFYILQDNKSHFRISNLDFLITDADTSFETVASDYSDQDWGSLISVHAEDRTLNNSFWFRYDVLQSQRSQAVWWMVVDWTQLEYLRIHVYDHVTQQWQHSKVVGTLFPVADRVVGTRNFVFPLRLTPEHRSTVYVELRTAFNVVMPITIWQRDPYVFHEQVSLVMLGLLMGGIGAMLVYNLCLYFILKEKAYLYYAIYVASVMLYLSCTTGIGNYFVWSASPTWSSRSYAASVGIIILASIVFAREFLSIRNYDRWVRTIYAVGIAVWAILAVNASLIGLDIVKPIIFPVIGITTVVGFFMPIYLWRKGNEQAKYFMIAWALLISGTMAISLVLSGVVQFSYPIFYAHLLSFFVELMLLSYALAGRINYERAQRIKAQQETMRLQRQNNDTLELRVHERTEELKETMHQLEQANQELIQLSVTDEMTKIYNRRHFDRVLVEEYRRAFRTQQPVAVLLLDIDHFKRINDTFGHNVGDQCLKLVAQTLSNQVKRSGDLVARYGGEEFVFVLPSTDLHDARQFAEQCRQKIGELGFEYNGVSISLSASVGVAGWIPTADNTYLKLVHSADHALYEAKNSGRNRVVVGPRQNQQEAIKLQRVT